MTPDPPDQPPSTDDPYPRATAHDKSFPSGHAAGTAVCVSLLVLAWPELSRRSAAVGPLPRQQRRLVATRRWAARGEGKPAQCGCLLHDSDLGIVAKYGCEYAGLIQYYLLAQDVFRLGRLRWCTMGLEVHHIRNLADLDQPGRRPAAEFTRRAAWRNGAGETPYRVPGRLAVHGVPVMARPTRQFWAVP